MCVSRGNMWLLCVCVKKGSFHPVNRYSFFFAINVNVLDSHLHVHAASKTDA